MENDDTVYDVVVVGAGLTGLSAAYRCHTVHKQNVLVLEGRSRVGGRTETETLDTNGSAGTFDHGARFFASYQRDVASLIQELELEPFLQYQGVETKSVVKSSEFFGLGANLLLDPSEAKPVAYVGPLIPDDTKGQFFLRYLTSMIDDFPVHDPTSAENAEALDQLSVHDWLEQLNLPGIGGPDEKFRHLVRVLCRVGFSEEPKNISALWLLFYLASNGGLDRFEAVRFPVEGAQAFRITTGAMSIAGGLRAKLEKASQKVKTNVTVRKIKQRPDADVEVYDDKGSRYLGKKVLIAFSPTLYSRSDFIEFTPEIPPERLAAARAMKMPATIVATVTFKNAFWRDPLEHKPGKFFGRPVTKTARHGFSGDVLALDGPVVWMMDASSAEGVPAIFAFIVADDARRLSELSLNERTETVKKELGRAFEDEKVKDNFVAYHERDWTKEKLSGGAPTAHFPKGTFYRHAKQILLNGNANPHDNVYFASTETSLTFNGYMSGAVWAGKRVADEICDAGRTRKREVTRDVRENSMLRAIRTVLRAVAEQNPDAEAPALSDNIQFYGPGGKVLDRGPYGGKSKTDDFYLRLSRHVTLTRVHIKSYCASPDTNSGFAAFSVSGFVNTTGNPFRDVLATMVFDFNEECTKITRDWLFLDSQHIDALVAAPINAFSSQSPLEERKQLESVATEIVEFRGVPLVDLPTQVIYTDDSGMVGISSASPPRRYEEAVSPLRDRFDDIEPKNVWSAFDYAAMIYYSSREFGEHRVVCTLRFSNPPVPAVSDVTFVVSKAIPSKKSD